MHILHLNQGNQRNQILFQYLRDKKKKERRGLRKRGGGGENSPISPPLDPCLTYVGIAQECFELRKAEVKLLCLRDNP